MKKPSSPREPYTSSVETCRYFLPSAHLPSLNQAFLAHCSRFTVPSTLVSTKISGLVMERSTWLSAAKLIT